MLETSHDQPEPGPVVQNDRVVGRCLSPGRGEVPNESMDEGWSPILASAESEEQAAIQPLDYSARLASAVRTRESLISASNRPDHDSDGIQTVETSTATSTAGQAQNEEDDDNMWVKVGGGIAVLGAAVVGGAFLAMQQENPSNCRGDGSGDRANISSVTIERLDDENETVNNEEWESTAADQQAQ